MAVSAPGTIETLQRVEHHELLAAELNHRVKNMLAIVQALVAQTIRGTRSTEQFREALEGRLRSLSIVHDLLAQREWRSIELTGLARSILAGYAGPDRCHCSGPEIRLSPNAAVSIALALHELTTNAVRHGALSAPSGQVAVNWQVEPEGFDRGVLDLTWIEQGKPGVSRPRHRGFGLRLIEQVSRELGARIAFHWSRGGLRCSLAMPLGAHAALGPPGFEQGPGFLDLRH